MLVNFSDPDRPKADSPEVSTPQVRRIVTEVKGVDGFPAGMVCTRKEVSPEICGVCKVNEGCLSKVQRERG